MRTNCSRVRPGSPGAYFIGILMAVFLMLPLPVHAAGEIELPDLNREGTISIDFRDGETGEPFSFGTKVGVFRVADISLDNGLSFVYDELFVSAGTPPRLASDFTDELAERLEEIAEFKGISLELPSEEISESGKATFRGLPPGLYLVVQTHRGTDSPTYQIRPFLVTIPVQNSDGSFVYDVKMKFTARENGKGSAELTGQGVSMVDADSVPVVQKKRETKLPVALFCLGIGLFAGLMISRTVRRHR